MGRRNFKVVCPFIIGSFQKTSIPPPQGKLEVNPPTPFGCPNTLTIIRNNFFPVPLRTAEISSVGGVWIFSGTTHSQIKTPWRIEVSAIFSGTIFHCVCGRHKIKQFSLYIYSFKCYNIQGQVFQSWISVNPGLALTKAGLVLTSALLFISKL